jgi:hypothetical protein
VDEFLTKSEISGVWLSTQLLCGYEVLILANGFFNLDFLDVKSPPQHQARETFKGHIRSLF